MTDYLRHYVQTLRLRSDAPYPSLVAKMKKTIQVAREMYRKATYLRRVK